MRIDKYGVSEACEQFPPKKGEEKNNLSKNLLLRIATVAQRCYYLDLEDLEDPNCPIDPDFCEQGQIVGAGASGFGIGGGNIAIKDYRDTGSYVDDGPYEDDTF